MEPDHPATRHQADSDGSFRTRTCTFATYCGDVGRWFAPRDAE